MLSDAKKEDILQSRKKTTKEGGAGDHLGSTMASLTLFFRERRIQRDKRGKNVQQINVDFKNLSDNATKSWFCQRT